MTTTPYGSSPSSQNPVWKRIPEKMISHAKALQDRVTNYFHSVFELNGIGADLENAADAMYTLEFQYVGTDDSRYAVAGISPYIRELVTDAYAQFLQDVILPAQSGSA